MALALLHYKGVESNQHYFDFELGSNRYFTFAIGDRNIWRHHGIKRLQNLKFTSKLMGPLPPERLGRGVLKMPTQLTDRENRYVQLTSYRTAAREGPSISDIVTVLLDSGSTILQASQQTDLTNFEKEQMPSRKLETVPFHFQEAKTVSTAMLLGNVTQVLPTIIPLLSGLFSGGSKAPEQDSKKPVLDVATLQQILNLLQTLTQEETAVAKTIYTEAMVDPISAAALMPLLKEVIPALAPVLQQLLKPETLKALNPIVQGGEIMLEGLKQNSADQKQLLDHLAKLTPKTDTPEMDGLFKDLSAGLTVSYPLDYQDVPQVRLTLANSRSHLLNGRARTLYRRDLSIGFPLQLDTPKSIKHGGLHICLKELTTEKIVWTKKYRVSDAKAGNLAKVPQIPAETLPNGEYELTVHLIWDNGGRYWGTHFSSLITLCDKFQFSHFDVPGETFSLEDSAQFGDYWHQIWASSFNDEIRRRQIDCKYYYSLILERPKNARLETISQLQPDGIRKETGRLKSGMELSLVALNDLLARLSTRKNIAPDSDPNPDLELPTLRALTNAELSSLQVPEVKQLRARAARVQVKNSGKPGERVALWVFPDVQLHTAVLKTVSAVDEHGQATELKDHPVYVPLPITAHFQGVTSSRDAETETSRKINHMPELFDIPVATYPVNLQRKKHESTTPKPSIHG